MTPEPEEDSSSSDWGCTVVCVGILAAIVVLLIMFGGEPDLMDAIIEHLRKP